MFAYQMTHDTKLMKRWLTVEQYGIAIVQMSFDNVTDAQFLRGSLQVSEL